MTTHHFSRRTFLRGLGVTMALPCTANSLPGSAAVQLFVTSVHTGSIASHVRGYFWRSHARSAGPGLKALANGVLAGKIFARESLVDHKDRWGFGVVSLAEVSPSDERNPHRAEVTGCHDGHIGAWPVRWRL